MGKIVETDARNKNSSNN